MTSIAENYARGTPNGIHMDADSALIWSPSHFTWMDTNYPAGTPREGYPVEIQVLWIRLLRLLEKISTKPEQKKWRDLADHATASFEKLFWLEEKGWFADVLLGGPRVIARDAVRDDALRSNYLFAVSLGLVTGERAQRCVEAAQKYLVVPGALRSLAPLPVSVPLVISGNDGRLLNNPPIRIGRVMKATRTRAANPPITTARRGRGRSRHFAKRWRGRGIFRRKRWRRRKVISAARKNC